MIDSKYKTPLSASRVLPKCTYCGRPAVYRRRTSGEYFCSACFTRAFIRRIRKTIAEYSMLTPTSSILLFFSPDMPVTSLAMIDSIIKLEKEYPTRIYISLPSDYNDFDTVERVLGGRYCGLKEQLYLVIGEYAGFFSSSSSLNDRYVLSRLLSLSIAEHVSVNSILLPYSLESLAVLVLANILSAKIDSVAYIEPVVRLNNITIGYPLYDTPWDDIVFYSYIRGIYELGLVDGIYSNCSKIEKRAYNIYRDLALISKELAYNILKNPSVFREALGLEKVSAECGGRIGKGMLNECSSLRRILGNIRVEILSPCQQAHP